MIGVLDVAEVRCAELRMVARHSLERLCVVNVCSVDGVPMNEPPLLQQLYEARVPSGESGGGGRGESRTPLALAVVDMLAAIEGEARGLLDALGKHVRLLGVLTMARMIQNMLPDVEDAALLEQVATMTRSWCVRVDELLHPVRKTPLDKECPSCGYAVYSVWSDDGDGLVRRSCLSAVWDGDRVDRVECGYCGAFWARHEMWEVISPSERAHALHVLSGVA